MTKIVEKFIDQANKECNHLISDTCKIMLNEASMLLNHMKRDESDIEA